MNEVKDLSLFGPFLAAKVEWKGQKHHFRFIFTGCKGDWPFLRSAYNLNCGYNCTAKCHRCELKETGQNSNYLIKDSIRVPIKPQSIPKAGCPLKFPGLPNFTSLATWAKEWYDVKGACKSLRATDTNPNPFKQDGTRSPFRDLPTGNNTKYIRIDPAHTWAIDGIGKDFTGSVIVMLVRMGHFGRGNVGHGLQNAYSNFMAYCSAFKKCTSITDFNFSTLKLPQNSFLHTNIHATFL
jgi:hypothetical protein